MLNPKLEAEKIVAPAKTEYKWGGDESRDGTLHPGCPDWKGLIERIEQSLLRIRQETIEECAKVLEVAEKALNEIMLPVYWTYTEVDLQEVTKRMKLAQQALREIKEGKEGVR